MDEQQLSDLIEQLAQVQDPNIITQFLNQLGENAEPFIQMIVQRAQQGDESAQMAFQNIQQVMNQQTPSMKLGAKINYIKSLRGQCPDGYEMKYFKRGGRICKECMRKQQKMEEGGITPMNAVNAFKCGRKMKKKEQGGKVESKKKLTPEEQKAYQQHLQNLAKKKEEEGYKRRLQKTNTTNVKK